MNEPRAENFEKKGIRLNKYVSNAGVCSRRKADEFIKAGKIKVNGEVVLEMGHKVQADDQVTFDGKVLNPERKKYVLLNKPKDFITTTADERGRKTVMDLIKHAAAGSRLYPVGRLDRMTTGLLLLTNDGELAQKLAHPSGEVKKIYQVTLDKTFTEEDFNNTKKGIKLEEGIAIVDDIAFPDPSQLNIVGVELHIGWNRIVRRIFESQGYVVKKLDRVVYAGLTKKDLPRGKWRFLSKEELIRLKYLGGEK